MELDSNNYKVQLFLIAITPWYLPTKINHLLPEVEQITMWKLKYLICVVCSGFLVLITPSPNWIYKKSNFYNSRFIPIYGIISHSFRIYGYAATWTSDEVFILGGYYSKHQATIAKYSNGAWSNIGKLVQWRYSHAAISHDGVTLIIGGSTDNGKP